MGDGRCLHQCRPGKFGDGNGGYTTNFADVSGPIIINVSGDTTTKYTDGGGATNGPARYYRIRLVP